MASDSLADQWRQNRKYSRILKQQRGRTLNDYRVMERRYLSTNRVAPAQETFLNTTLQNPHVNLTMRSQNSKKSLDQYSHHFSEEHTLQTKPQPLLQDPAQKQADHAY